jgi:hypothetical protein
MKVISLVAVLLSGAPLLLAASKQKDCKAASSSLATVLKNKTHQDALKELKSAVTASPDCSCELIRTAIQTATDKPSEIAALVEEAISAAPDKKDIIVTCALATAPDAWNNIIVVGQKYGVSTNPLDFPGVLGQNLILLSPANVTYYVSPNKVTSVDPNKPK